MPYHYNQRHLVCKLIFRISLTISSIVGRTLLGLAFFVVYWAFGSSYDWPYHVPIAVMLGFTPWGWKVQAVRRKEQEARELKRIRAKMESDGFYYSQTDFRFRQTTIASELILGWFKLLTSGFWGIVLGWKVCYDMLCEIIDDFQLIMDCW